MAFQRELWGPVFSKHAIPKYPCPCCSNGRLISEDDEFLLREPRYSEIGRTNDDFEPDWITERFYISLQCDHNECGEIVTVVGDTELTEERDDEIGWYLISALRPRCFYPAPLMFLFPAKLSMKVERELRTAFMLFWTDVGSAGNRLRTSIEYLLDDLKVPREIISKKSGKLVELDLNGRIQNFEKQSPDHAMTFHALRIIGNIGSHSVDLTREAFLDAIELYVNALEELLSGKKARLKALQSKIIDTKGKY